MKKLIIIAIALASTNAFATRARVTALGNSPHLIDTQTVYSNPADMMMMGDYVTFESGTNGGGATEGANSEGMITRSMGEAKMGLSLGHQSKNASIWGLRAAALTGMALKSQQNPVEISYGMKSGDMAWAGTLVYSNYNDKVNEEKESSMGLRAGLRMGALDAKLGLGLGNEWSSLAAGKYKGTTGITLGAGYQMDTMYYSGFVTMAGFKTENTTVETGKFDSTEFEVSMVNSLKKEGNLEGLYYGVGLNNKTEKFTNNADEGKLSQMKLPVWIGMETEANSWLTLRGSIKQDVMISNRKVENTGTVPAYFSAQAGEFAPGANTTTANVGAGLKFNKVTLDGTLSTATTQLLDGTNLLAKVGMTYMF